MENFVIKQEYLNQIKSDVDLYAGVSKALNISPSSLPAFIYRNDARLTQAGVLQVIGRHLGIQDLNKLLEKQVAA